jgi:hypothetical protein
MINDELYLLDDIVNPDSVSFSYHYFLKNNFQTGKNQIPFEEGYQNKDNKAGNEHDTDSNVIQSLPAAEYEHDCEDYQKFPKIAIHVFTSPQVRVILFQQD